MSRRLRYRKKDLTTEKEGKGGGGMRKDYLDEGRLMLERLRTRWYISVVASREAVDAKPHLERLAAWQALSEYVDSQVQQGVPMMLESGEKGWVGGASAFP